MPFAIKDHKFKILKEPGPNQYFELPCTCLSQVLLLLIACQGHGRAGGSLLDLGSAGNIRSWPRAKSRVPAKESLATIH